MAEVSVLLSAPRGRDYIRNNGPHFAALWGRTPVLASSIALIPLSEEAGPGGPAPAWRPAPPTRELLYKFWIAAVFVWPAAAATATFTCAACHKTQASTQPVTSMGHALELVADCEHPAGASAIDLPVRTIYIQHHAGRR